MDATGHLRASLTAAVALANGFGAEFAQGRPRPAGDDGTVRAALRLTTDRAVPVELETFAAGGRALYGVLALLVEGAVDDAAARANDLLATTRAVPRLERRDGRPWHLHFVNPEVSEATGWIAEFATAVAMLIGSDDVRRLRRCAADRCDTVFLDSTRSRTQRFCSAGCQNRTKVAAYRARA